MEEAAGREQPGGEGGDLAEEGFLQGLGPPGLSHRTPVSSCLPEVTRAAGLSTSYRLRSVQGYVGGPVGPAARCQACPRHRGDGESTVGDGVWKDKALFLF